MGTSPAQAKELCLAPEAEGSHMTLAGELPNREGKKLQIETPADGKNQNCMSHFSEEAFNH